MPADTSATEFQDDTLPRGQGRPGLPDGAGVVIAIAAGAAIWAGILALFLM